jgi:hypothetical protein
MIPYEVFCQAKNSILCKNDDIYLHHNVLTIYLNHRKRTLPNMAQSIKTLIPNPLKLGCLFPALMQLPWQMTIDDLYFLTNLWFNCSGTSVSVESRVRQQPLKTTCKRIAGS